MLKNMKVSHKIIFICVGLICIFTLTISWEYLQLRNNLYKQKKIEIQHAVETAWGTIDYYVKQAESGNMPLGQAQASAKEAVKHLRFASTNYFWINDLNPVMIMHPIKPKLDGKDLSAFKDPSGKKLFNAMAKIVKKDGQGFVDYLWSKPGFEKPVPKISFVKGVPEWKWLVGAGIYLDDIKAIQDAVFFRLIQIVVAVIVLSMAMVVLVAKGISGSIQKTVSMIQDLEGGKLDSRLHLDQLDEIGVMARSMDAFADNMQHEILTAFEKLSIGDFTFQAQGVIKEPLLKTNTQLSLLISDILASSDQISSGSSQVSDSSQELSQGATEQAASLEQISSSMAQIQAQTKTNAENAGKARMLTSDCKDSAVKGNEKMIAMSQAMDEIDESSQQISNIIKVIDEIAFQTNLLALNAAVEAARAGRHGKGFAVVAEEVRNLAGRCAKAAQETEELIQSSVQKIKNGTTIADETGKALLEIVDSVAKVTALVSKIADSSNHQAQGTAQVNMALGQIDQVTQQNTANAEQTAAASEELSGQALSMKEMMSRFKTKD